MEALQGAAGRFGIECAGGYVIGIEIIKQGARHGGLADPALVSAYHDHYRLRHELPLYPSNPDRSGKRMRSENPHSCFGREHGRNKGEFNSLGGRLGLILPMSLMLQRPSEPAFPV